MCTVCNAPEKRNLKSEALMTREYFVWLDTSWYAITPEMSAVQMREYLRTTILRNNASLATSMATGGTFNVWSVNGDVSYTVINSGDRSRLYKDEID
jgi:hypothetical protein